MHEPIMKQIKHSPELKLLQYVLHGGPRGFFDGCESQFTQERITADQRRVALALRHARVSDAAVAPTGQTPSAATEPLPRTVPTARNIVIL